MKGIKGASARQINILLQREGALWERDSYDRMVRDEEEFQEKVQYILTNPLRKGLATKIGEYPFVLDLRGETETLPV